MSEENGRELKWAFPPSLSKATWATKYPLQHPEVALPMPAVDPREASLRVLRSYFSRIKFRTETGKHSTQVLQIPEDRIFTEWPDNEDFLSSDVAIVFLGQEGGAEYGSLGLGGPVIDEDTDDVYGKGTIVYEHSAYTETVRMRVVCSSRALRRGVIAGIEAAFNPLETVLGLRFYLTDHYGRLARCILDRGGRVDSEESIKNRRVVDFTFRLYTVCAVLIRRPLMVPSASVDVVPADAADG